MNGKDRKRTSFLVALIPYLKPYRKRIYLWFGIYALFFLCPILTTYAVRVYVDRVLHSGKEQVLIVFVFLYMAYALAYHLFYFYGFRGTQAVVEDVVADLRVATYEKMHRLRIRFFDKTQTGEIFNRVTQDTRQILQLVGGELVNVSLQILRAAVAFSIILATSVDLALVVLAFIPAYGWLFWKLLPRVRKLVRRWRRADDRLWGNWGEKLRGMAIVQAFAREKGEALKHHSFGHRATGRWYAATMAGTRMGVLGGLAGGVASHTAFLVGCFLVVRGHLSLGASVTIGGFSNYIRGAVESLFNLVNAWQQSAVAGERIIRFMAEVEEVKGEERLPRVGRLRGEVRFDQVYFEYEVGRPVLHDIRLHVREGQNVALVGHTGCGKSTMVNLLQGFYHPVSGSILIDGIPTTQINPKDLRKNIGAVSQDVVLFQDTVRANVSYGKAGAPEADLWKVLEAAQIADYVKGLPNGLDTRIMGGDEGVSPSEGEAQRLAIARALLTDPSLVILDEATSSLDSKEEARLQEAVKGLLRGRTAFIIAHRLSTVRGCDLVVVMERGRILEAGSPGELLLKREGAYARLHAAHFGAVSA